MKLVLFLAWTVIPAFAQFGSLATTYDGSQVYFVSNLRQAGTSQPPWGKVFIADSGGIRPLAIRNRDAGPGLPGDQNTYSTNAFNLTGVAVAHDGSRLALLGIAFCNYGDICAYGEQAQTDFYDITGPDMLTFGLRAELSPNGRWALLCEYSPAFLSCFAMGTANLVTGQSSTTTWQNNLQWQALAIADDGAIALTNGGAIDLIRPDGQSVPVAANATAGAFDSGGETLVWVGAQRGQSPGGLQVLNTSTLAVRVLFDNGSSYAPAISDDGKRVLFLSTASAEGSAQVFAIGTDGTGLRQVSHEASGIQSATLSGDGHIAWAATGDGSVVRLGIDSGEATPLIGPSPEIDVPPGGVLNASRGQTIEVTGGRLTPQGGEVQAQSGGVPLPVLSANNTSITFQVAWGATPNAAYDVEFTIPGRQDPAWVPAVRLNLAAAAPQFAGMPIHQGFTGAISTSSPARPGEVITLYAVGLGPVAPPVASGQAAPVSPLSYLVGGLACLAQDASGGFVPLDVPFAGLAPGTIGYYQVNVRLPDSFPNVSNLLMQCGQASGLLTSIPVAP